MKRYLLAGLIVAFSGTAASAATLVNSFDSDAEGWTGTGGSVSWQSTGGNPDGHITMTDSTTTFMSLSAGPTFLGDLSAYDGGTFSFDAIQTTQGSGSYLGGFGEVTLSGGGFSTTLDVFTENPDGNWETASVSFDAATWGMSEANWDALLSNVTSFRIETESWNGVSETVGIDNVTLMSAVPVPAAGMLLLTALGGLGWVRRRKA